MAQEHLDLLKLVTPGTTTSREVRPRSWGGAWLPWRHNP